MDWKIIFGILFILGGIAIILIPYVGWIYGPILILIGILMIVLRKEENKIEQRKDISKHLNNSKSIK